eukprot:9812156-Lingulodinium_polyedra.AAC.1
MQSSLPTSPRQRCTGTSITHVWFPGSLPAICRADIARVERACGVRRDAAARALLFSSGPFAGTGGWPGECQ